MTGTVVKTFEIIDANKEAFIKFEKAMKRKKVIVYQVKNRVLFQVENDINKSQEMIAILEEHAFDLELDYAKVKLVLLDAEAGELDDSQRAIIDFAKENHIEDYVEGVPLSLFPEFIQFIRQDNSKISEETEVFSETLQESASVEEVQENAFVDDVATPEKIHIEDEEEIKPEALSGQQFVSEKEEPSVIKTKEEKEEDNDQFYMEKAKAIFETSEYIRLPNFDQIMHEKLYDQLLEAQFKIAEAKGESIQAIYDRLKNESLQTIEQIETARIEAARTEHENALNQIESNLNIEIHRLLTERDEEYARDRERYIEAQIPIIRKKYDAENFANHQQVLDTEIDDLKRISTEEKEKENERFLDYLRESFSAGRNQVLSTVRVDDIVDKYNDVAREQREVLQMHAKDVQSEIGTTISGIVKERDEIREALEDYKSQIGSKVEQEKARARNELSKSFSDKEEKLLQEHKAKLDQAYKKEQDLLRQIETLEKSIEFEKEEKQLLERKTVEIQDDGTKEVKNQDVVVGNENPLFTKVRLIITGASLLAVIIIGVLGIAAVNGVQKEAKANNKVQESMYLEQLQSNGKYDKAAREMTARGYDKKTISEMYLENGKYTEALKKDASIAPEFYEWTAEKEPDEQKEILETVKSEDVLGGKQDNAINTRLAVLNKDDSSIAKLTEDTTAATAKVAIQYYIAEKKFTEAGLLLKKYHDAKLSDELEKAEEANAKERLNTVNKDIDTLSKKIEDANKKDANFRKELDSLKKAKADSKKIDAKVKQIKDVEKQRGTDQATLKQKQAEKTELEKDL